jgi:hypothetical protein
MHCITVWQTKNLYDISGGLSTFQKSFFNTFALHNFLTKKGYNAFS